jgi:hypothetical protein
MGMTRAAFAADADGSELLPGPTASDGATPAVSPTFPLSSVPLLDSYNPTNTSTPKLYLDFVGDTTTSWGAYDPGTTPAYDTDGDPTTFSATELANIQQIWSRVAEKFSPFNLDVTTVPPTNTSLKHEVTMVIGGTGTWYQLAGGVSYVSSFISGPNKSFVFSNNLAQTNHGVPKYVAEAIAHEAGHEFGLIHQSDWVNGVLQNNGYSFGTYNYDPTQIPHPAQPGSKSPIMGDSYYADRGLWWDGTDLNSPTEIQDDMSIISGAANGFGYRPDDVGNNAATATALSLAGNLYSAHGVIEQTTDKDFYSFTSTGGLVSFLVAVAQYGPMLDASAEILDSSGDILAQQDTSSLSEFVYVTLPTTSGLAAYDLVVYSHGDYGDVGQYSVSGEIGGMVPEPTSLALGGVIVCMMARRKRV